MITGFFKSLLLISSMTLILLVLSNIPQSEPTNQFIPVIQSQPILTEQSRLNIPSPKRFKIIITFYTGGTHTASGCEVRSGGSAASDPKTIPMGTRCRLIGFDEGVSNWIMCDDTGSKVIGNHIDVHVANEHYALKLGVIEAVAEWRIDRIGRYLEVDRQ